MPLSFEMVLLMEEILHQLIRSLSLYLQGCILPRWCGISSINSMTFLYGSPLQEGPGIGSPIIPLHGPARTPWWAVRCSQAIARHPYFENAVLVLLAESKVVGRVDDSGFSLPETKTASLPLKIGRIPKRNECYNYPFLIDYFSFREGIWRISSLQSCDW